jgi:hypothetical protein
MSEPSGRAQASQHPRRSTICATGLLFFKFQESEATLKHYSGSVSINDKLLIEISPEIKSKVAAFTLGYVKSLPDLD